MEKLDITVLKALAVEPRARIVSLLRGRCLCAGALARILEITPGAVSQHLNVLKDSGLVVAEKRSYFMHYRIAPGAHTKAREALDALFKNTAHGIAHSGKCATTCSCPKHKGYVA
jgi:ArsR family transcriptional regulator, arsenate/arsenite/antimonite-responsive transcriptional repressor